MTGMRIAVLGAGGFLGSHLVEALLQRPGGEIDAVDLGFQKLETRDPRVRHVCMRVGQRNDIDPIVARSDVIFSLTALCNPALYNTAPLDVIDGSYTDLVPVVQSCTKYRKRLIHFSTCEVYGRTALDREGRPMAEMSEDDTGFFLGPIDRERWTYACAKQLLERVIWAHGQHQGLAFTIIRPFNVIGPRMDFLPGIDGEGVPRVLASFMNALLRADDLLLVDGGVRRRSFTYVDEFVDGVVRALDRPEVSCRQVFNLGNPDNNVSMLELAEGLARAFAARVPLAKPATFRSVPATEVYGPGYDDCPDRIPDIGKARRLLGWEPRTSLPEMLAPIIDDYVARYGRAVWSGSSGGPERKAIGQT